MPIMEIKIYQINMERDPNMVCFMSHDRLEKLQGSQQIDSQIYDKVYEGAVDCSGLEGVYRIFNVDHPADYRGRSLSVSDVVEIVSAPDTKPGFYFCDSVGFKEVSFEPEKVKAPKQDTIRVVLVEPGKVARITDIDASLAGMQKVVGGDIEGFYPFEEQVCIVCNDEGKLNGMPLNRAIREEDTITDVSYGELTDAFREAERNGSHMTGYIVFSQDSFTEPYSEEARTYVVSSNNKAFQPNMGGYSIYGSSLDGKDRCVRLEGYMAAEHGGEKGWKIERCYTKEEGRDIIDIVAGSFFICDCSGENFGSLNKEQLDRYCKKYQNPERFFKRGETIVAVPYKPEKDHER